jgi:diamine N-acetyltransferase
MIHFIEVGNMFLRGEKIELRPMTKDDLLIFYKWATQSDATPFWYGNLYGDKIPTYEEFTKDWKHYFFNGTKPDKGRCFIIVVNNKIIGQVNYNEIDRNTNSVELDIIIAENIDTGKGYGSDALRTLCSYLFEEMNIQECTIDAISKNPRAIRAYQKAGFKIKDTFMKNNIDWVHMALFKDDLLINL